MHITGIIAVSPDFVYPHTQKNMKIINWRRLLFVTGRNLFMFLYITLCFPPPPHHPTGSQEVPIAESDWDYHKEKGIWEQTHFFNCIIEGLKRAPTKPLNYANLADIEQRQKEVPGRFLERLPEGLQKFTNNFPESAEGETVLKDKFLTH